MRNTQKGQVLLIVILIMIVALTVGLSVAVRSITNIKLTADSSDSQKAFQAAEAGIEEVLGSNTSANITAQNFSPGVVLNVTVTQVSGGATTGSTFYYLENNGLAINQDDGTDIWLSTYNSDPTLRYQNPWSGHLTVYWGKSTNACSDAALEIMIISGSITAPSFARYAVDPCGARTIGSTGNHFSVANTTAQKVSGQQFYYVASVTVNSGLIARIVPLYSSTPIAISADNAPNFPSQGRIITSSATAGTATRKLVFFQGYDSIPSEFFYSLFSTQ